MNLTNQQKGSLLAFIAVFLITPDSLLIRLSSIDTWGMLFYRGAIPFVFVLTGTLLFYNKNFLKVLFGIGYPGIFYIFSFSACNITFIISIQNTNVANTLVMIALAPMLSAILGAIFLKEAPDKKTWTAIIITFLACVYIFYDSLKLGNFYGDFFGLVTAFGLACNANLARYAKDRDLVPSAVLGKLFVAIFAFFFVKNFDLVKFKKKDKETFYKLNVYKKNDHYLLIKNNKFNFLKNFNISLFLSLIKVTITQNYNLES